jgi:hypothetical protein
MLDWIRDLKKGDLIAMWFRRRLRLTPAVAGWPHPSKVPSRTDFGWWI